MEATELIEFKPIRIIIGSSIGQFDHYSYYSMLINKNADQLVPHFYIKRSGELHKLIPINKPSKYTTYDLVDGDSISIELENVGLLNINENNEFIDHFGNIYNNTENVSMEYFRGGKYWENYTIDQIITIKNLIEILTDEYKINNKMNDVVNAIPLNDNGIVFRSNISFIFNDPNKNILKWKITQD